MRAYTQYAMLHLGDVAGTYGPEREIDLICYDGSSRVLSRCTYSGMTMYVPAKELFNRSGAPLDISQVPLANHPVFADLP